MKRCPACQRTYTDESLTFCLEDGSPLLSEASSSASSDEPPATMIFNEPPATSSNRSAAPTEVYNANATQGTTPPSPAQNTSGGASYGQTTPPPSWTPQPSAPHSQPFGQTSWPAATGVAAPNKFLLGIIGGVVMALPSLVPAIQFGCCLWAAAGGLLAAALYIKKSPTKVELGEGAILGAIAGGVGGLINLVAGLPLAYALYGPAGPYKPEDGSYGGVMVVVGIFGTLMLVGFAVAGGLLAVPMFEKRKSGPNAPPPYGGSAGGYR